MSADRSQIDAPSWRNTVSCMCSAKVDAKGAVLDKSACPIHGKATKRRALRGSHD